MIFPNTVPHLVVQASLALITWALYTVISRLYFHPLRSFPGPRLAAFSEIYAAYYEFWKEGMFVQHLLELHRIYGPVVRIRPNELHFSTPQAFFAIYPSRSGFTKDPALYKALGADGGSLALIDVKAHKARRDLINPLFSRRAIIKFEQSVQDIIDLFLENLSAYKEKPVNFKFAFRSLTMDVITTYCFGYSLGGVSAPDFDHTVPPSLGDALKHSMVVRYIPIARALLKLPTDMLKYVNAKAVGYKSFQETAIINVDKYLASPHSVGSVDHEIIYHHLLPESVDRSEWPAKQSLIDETALLVGAGIDTTSNTLSVGLYHIIKDKAVKKTLEDEIMTAWPEKDSPFSYEQAEKLRFLSSVVKEALRLSNANVIALPRVATFPTVIDGSQVPAGTVVGCSSVFLLMDPKIFPEPHRFMPERWMQADTTALEKHLVVFSRGPRNCVGMNLAWCELYVTFSHLVRKFEMELHDTSDEDMELRAYMLPSWHGRGLRAVLKERTA